MVNYGIAYGLSAFGLADRLNIERDEAATYIERYFERFPAVKAFIDETIADAGERGYVRTLMGRRRNIPELRSGNPQRRGLGERLAVNTVIQGTAADIIKVAMVNCHRAVAEAGLETELVLQIHDELLFEGPEAEMDARGRDRRAGDDRRLRARPAAGGRRRRRGRLAGGEVALQLTVPLSRCRSRRCRSRRRRCPTRCCRSPAAPSPQPRARPRRFPTPTSRSESDESPLPDPDDEPPPEPDESESEPEDPPEPDPLEPDPLDPDPLEPDPLDPDPLEPDPLEPRPARAAGARVVGS